MVNVKELTLKTKSGSRNLFLSPLLLQSGEIPKLDKPAKAYVYEDLVKVSFWDHIGGKPRTFPFELKDYGPVIKHDQDFAKAYLGHLEFIPGKKWQWQSGDEKLSKEEIVQLEQYANSLK